MFKVFSVNKPDRKVEQLQIRVSARQKREIREKARRAGMSMSDWVLSQIAPSAQEQFQDLLADLACSDAPGYEFAELLDLLQPLGAHEFELAVSAPPRVPLEPYWDNYVAATVEHAAWVKHAKAPSWTKEVPALDEPAFGSSLKSVRWYLLTHSPPAFSQRNIFIDATVGDRV